MENAIALPILPLKWIRGEVSSFNIGQEITTNKAENVLFPLFNDIVTEIIHFFYHHVDNFPIAFHRLTLLVEDTFEYCEYENENFLESFKSDLSPNYPNQIKDFKNSIFFPGDEVYNLTADMADKALSLFCKCGDAVRNEEEGIALYFNFFRKYGLPVNEMSMSPIEKKFSMPHQMTANLPFRDGKKIIFDSILLSICNNLWKNIKNKDNAMIGDMANKTQNKEGKWLITWSPGDFEKIMDNLPSKNSALWSKLAKDWLANLVKYYSYDVHLIPTISKDGKSALGVQPSGLLSALWLAFWTRIDRFDNEQTLPSRLCRNDGNYTGCGNFFTPTNSRQRLCPDCQKNAHNRVQRRHRERKKNSLLLM